MTTIKDNKDHQTIDGIRHSVCQLLFIFSLAKDLKKKKKKKKKQQQQ